MSTNQSEERRPEEEQPLIMKHLREDCGAVVAGDQLIVMVNGVVYRTEAHGFSLQIPADGEEWVCGKHWYCGGTPLVNLHYYNAFSPDAPQPLLDFAKELYGKVTRVVSVQIVFIY